MSVPPRNLRTSKTGPSEFVRIEARALLELAIRLDGAMREPFARACELLAQAISERGRVIVLGVGKSGLIGRKIAATMCSTGTPAHFLHPSEALHGDLGMIAPGDVLLALSASGETEELLTLLPVLARLGNPLISLCGMPDSTLARASAIAIDSAVTAEACAMNLAPTASTTVMLALGDALAIEVSRQRGFDAAAFGALHPGGRLGRRLGRISDLMHTGHALPAVLPHTPMPDVIHEMSHKKLGMTTVLDRIPTAQDHLSPSSTPPARLLGMISDGDLRRMLERDGSQALAHTAGEIMNSRPVTIAPDAFADDALTLMEQRKITSLIVVSATEEALGIVHLHDLWTASPRGTDR